MAFATENVEACALCTVSIFIVFFLSSKSLSGWKMSNRAGVKDTICSVYFQKLQWYLENHENIPPSPASTLCPMALDEYKEHDLYLNIMYINHIIIKYRKSYRRGNRRQTSYVAYTVLFFFLKRQALHFLCYNYSKLLAENGSPASSI